MGPHDDLLEHGSDRPAPRPRRSRLLTVVAALAAVIVGSVLVVQHRDARARHDVTASHSAPAHPLSPPPAAKIVRKTVSTLDGRLKVDLVAVTKTGFGHGTLLIMGRLTGATPGRQYAMVGGDCTVGRNLPAPWAVGAADRRGRVFLAGPIRRLPVVHDYYLYLERRPAHRSSRPHRNGVHGLWLQGRASPLADRRAPCV